MSTPRNDTAVRKWQERLNQATGSNLTVDGRWGRKTEAAYQKYLASQGRIIPQGAPSVTITAESTGRDIRPKINPFSPYEGPSYPAGSPGQNVSNSANRWLRDWVKGRMDAGIGGLENFTVNPATAVKPSKVQSAEDYDSTAFWRTLTPNQHKKAAGYYHLATDQSFILDNEDKKTLRSVAVHEQNHELQQRLKEQQIADPKRDAWGLTTRVINQERRRVRTNDPEHKQHSDDSYFGDPREIHSRIMQMRMDGGLKPGEVVTPERYKKLKSQIREGPTNRILGDLHEVLDDDGILRILNETVSNDQPQPMISDTFYAALGGTLPRYAKGGGTDAVRQYQKMLNDMTGSTLKVDGRWGPKTQAAYQSYLAQQQGGTGLNFNDDEYSQVPVSSDSFAGYTQPDFWGAVPQSITDIDSYSMDDRIQRTLPGDTSRPYLSGDYIDVPRNGVMPEHGPLTNNYPEVSVDPNSGRDRKFYGDWEVPQIPTTNGGDHQFRGQWEVPQIPTSSGGDHQFRGQWEVPHFAEGGFMSVYQDKPKPASRSQVDPGFNDRYSGNQYFEWKKQQQAQRVQPQSDSTGSVADVVRDKIRRGEMSYEQYKELENQPYKGNQYAEWKRQQAGVRPQTSDEPSYKGNQYFEWKKQQTQQNRQRDLQLIQMYGRDYYMKRRAERAKNPNSRIIDKNDLTDYNILDLPGYAVGGAYNPFY